MRMTYCSSRTGPESRAMCYKNFEGAGARD
jgi:hypothetical protein